MRYYVHFVLLLFIASCGMAAISRRSILGGSHDLEEGGVRGLR